MGNFFAELKRRHIYRVAAAYAVVAWILLQLVNNIAPGLNLPNWAISFVIVILAIGFPIALIFAWVLHLASAESSAHAKSGVSDWILAGAAVAVIAVISYQQIASRTASPQQQANASSVIPAPQPAGISIAVLPFTNMSGDAGQEFFSDGMTEELNSALAKIADLQVVARISAFQFKGQNQDVRAVGQALGATHLIEGSVRKVGNRVRITAQLVRADNGLQLWSENYDRSLTDIFAIQEEIAQAIAASLRVPLGLFQGARLVSNRATNLQSYDDYLRAKALVRARAVGLKPVTDAATLLEQVVARDPNYAPAWAQMALAYVVMPTFHPATINGLADEARSFVEESLPKAEAAANRALQLDPNLAEAYLAQGYLQYVRQKLVAAEDLLAKALALDGSNPDALSAYATLLADVGRVKESLAMRQKVQTLEPFVPLFKNSLALLLWLNGQTEEAIAILKAAAPDQFIAPFYLSRIYAAEGRYKEAAESLLRIPVGIFRPGRIEAAANLLRTAPASPQAVTNFGFLNWIYAYVGAPVAWLDAFDSYIETSGYLIASGSSPFWHPSYTPVRKLERFKTVMRNAGIVDYWKARGWPDLCRPVGANGFECD